MCTDTLITKTDCMQSKYLLVLMVAYRTILHWLLATLIIQNYSYRSMKQCFIPVSKPAHFNLLITSTKLSQSKYSFTDTVAFAVSSNKYTVYLLEQDCSQIIAW